MIITYNRRKIAEVSASGHSTEDVEEMFDDERVKVYTNKEAEDIGMESFRRSAPGSIYRTVNEIDSDAATRRNEVR